MGGGELVLPLTVDRDLLRGPSCGVSRESTSCAIVMEGCEREMRSSPQLEPDQVRGKAQAFQRF